MSDQRHPYKESFPRGSGVRIANREALDEFRRTWNYHHRLEPEQLDYADRETTVESVGFYHGGDPVYTLKGIPGSWLEPCLARTAG